MAGVFTEVTRYEEETHVPPLPSPPGIDLENIVYYKDDTHYFVMTAKKQCLLRLGVLRQVRQAGAPGGETEAGQKLSPLHPWGGESLSCPCPFLHPNKLPSAGIYMVT